MLPKLIESLDLVTTSLNKCAGWIATSALALMTTIVTVHVIGRYGFNYSFHWTEEIARYLMVWMTFLYFPTGHKRYMNVAVEFAVAPWAHTKAGITLKILIEILALVTLATLFFLAFGMIKRATLSQALHIPMYYIYAVLPFSFALTALCAIENMLRHLSNLLGIEVKPPKHMVEAVAVD